MGLLYKDSENITISVDMKQTDEIIEFEFTADCGKFGTDESIAGYKFTPQRLYEIFSNIEISEDEIL